MQFRQAGNRVQVLAYRGYDKEKRRAVIKLLGSYDRSNTDNRTENLTYEMTGDELKEFQSHIEAIRLSDEKDRRLAQLRNIAAEMSAVAQSLGKPDIAAYLTTVEAGEIFQAMELLTAAIKRVGLTKAGAAAALAEAGKLAGPDGVTRRKRKVETADSIQSPSH